jgi:hypothetical protein
MNREVAMSPSRSSAVQSLEPIAVPEPLHPEAAPARDARGFLSLVAFQTDNVLRNRDAVYGQITERRDLPGLMTVAFGGLYGAMMGLHGGAAQAVAAAVKVPLLLVASMAALTPPLYAFNTMMGSRMRGMQLAALAASTVATTSVILLALAPFALFLNFAGVSYSALKLAQIALFFVAGYSGAFFMYDGMQTVAARLGRDQNLPLLQVWLLVYAYVGMQMAWMLRPFVGNPASGFSFFRPLSGSFFTGVMDALTTVLR